mmetsp:Transcript_27184/g.64733  ORF Transcript_27184/g.64733 Transcript_27184/m.64733 type:complete len:307 (-) Transcript_27184:513-1433(-)
MRPRKDDCGVKGCSGWPSSCLRRLAASGGPCRTAKTPALGRGCSSTAATSPEAKTPAQLVEASVGCTAMNPCGSRARPLSTSHGCAPPCVHQMTSSYAMSEPSAQWRCVSEARATSFPASSVTPRSCSTRSKMARTPGECCGITCALRETSETCTPTSDEAVEPGRDASRACTAKASSTPPAPPPTTTSRTGALPGVCCCCTRRTITSQRAQKPSIGFTGVIDASGAVPPPAAPAPSAGCDGTGCGAEPMSMESTSYATGGRPLSSTRRCATSIPHASAWISRAFAKVASRGRSMWHSSRVYMPAT